MKRIFFYVLILCVVQIAMARFPENVYAYTANDQVTVPVTEATVVRSASIYTGNSYPNHVSVTDSAAHTDDFQTYFQVDGTLLYDVESTRSAGMGVDSVTFHTDVLSSCTSGNAIFDTLDPATHIDISTVTWDSRPGENGSGYGSSQSILPLDSGNQNYTVSDPGITGLDIGSGQYVLRPSPGSGVDCSPSGGTYVDGAYWLTIYYHYDVPDPTATPTPTPPSATESGALTSVLRGRCSFWSDHTEGGANVWYLRNDFTDDITKVTYSVMGGTGIAQYGVPGGSLNVSTYGSGVPRPGDHNIDFSGDFTKGKILGLRTEGVLFYPRCQYSDGEYLPMVPFGRSAASGSGQILDGAFSSCPDISFTIPFRALGGWLKDWTFTFPDWFCGIVNFISNTLGYWIIPNVPNLTDQMTERTNEVLARVPFAYVAAIFTNTASISAQPELGDLTFHLGAVNFIRKETGGGSTTLPIADTTIPGSLYSGFQDAVDYFRNGVKVLIWIAVVVYIANLAKFI